MKKMFLTLIMLLTLSTSVFAAEESQKLIVAFDSKRLTGQIVNVAFTNKPFTPIDDVSNFNDFSSLTKSEIVDVLELNVGYDANELYASNNTPLYISFQMYTSTPVDIVISQDGPLKDTSIPGQTKILDWKVYMKGRENDLVADTSNVNLNSFVVFKADPKNFGICDSRELCIKTYGIDVDKVGSYVAHVEATIRTIN